MKTSIHKIGRDLEFEVTFEWEDTSFSHEFGTKVQGYYEISDIQHEGQSLPLDIFDEKFLNMLVERYTWLI